MINESLGRDLQIRVGHFYVKLLLHGTICITKCQCASTCFSYIPSSSPGHLLVIDCLTIPETLAIRSQWVNGKVHVEKF